MTLGRCPLSIFCSRGTPPSKHRESTGRLGPLPPLPPQPPTWRYLHVRTGRKCNLHTRLKPKPNYHQASTQTARPNRRLRRRPCRTETRRPRRTARTAAPSRRARSASSGSNLLYKLLYSWVKLEPAIQIAIAIWGARSASSGSRPRIAL